jgi:hypothetical protein
MHQITEPIIKLHTIQHDNSTYLNALILEYHGNNFHLHGGTRDTISVFTEGLGIYVLTINKLVGCMGLQSFMVPEPDSINCMFLHHHREIRETLGAKWESMRPETIVQRLMECLI